MNFVKQNILKMIAGAALAVLIAMPVGAQDQIKIGVVSITALLENAPQTNAAMTSLQEEFAPRQREFAAKQKELEDLTAKAQKDAAVMGETERKNLEKDLRDLQREVTRLQDEFTEDLNLRRNEELATLQRTLLTEVQDFASQEGYDLVIGDGVLYASGAVNITEAVLRAVQANYQATGAAQ